jgi:hypothetical protein
MDKYLGRDLGADPSGGALFFPTRIISASISSWDRLELLVAIGTLPAAVAANALFISGDNNLG